MPKSDNNKDKSTEEVIKITVFLVPLILAISIFIFQAVEYASSVQSYSTITGYWESIFNNPLFIGAMITIILSWLFLIIYYFKERTERHWLFISGFIVGFSILLLDFLVFFPNVPGLPLVTYSNFLYQPTALIIFVVILLAIIIYWICLLYKAIKAQPHKPFMDRQQKILEIHSLIGQRDTMFLVGIALLAIGCSLVIAILPGKIHTNLTILSADAVFAIIIGLIAMGVSAYRAKQVEKKIDALGK